MSKIDVPAMGKLYQWDRSCPDCSGKYAGPRPACPRCGEPAGDPDRKSTYELNWERTFGPKNVDVITAMDPVAGTMTVTSMTPEDSMVLLVIFAWAEFVGELRHGSDCSVAGREESWAPIGATPIPPCTCGLDRLQAGLDTLAEKWGAR